MPVRNSERFLAPAVDGILAQTFKDFELVIVDGGSTDRTLDILSGYKDARIPHFSGAAGNHAGQELLRRPLAIALDCRA